MVVLLREYSCPASEASVHWTVLISLYEDPEEPDLTQLEPALIEAETDIHSKTTRQQELPNCDCL